MMTEIEIAKKLSDILDISSQDNIVNSGKSTGINVYKDNINILIAKKNDENENDISSVKEKIKKLFVGLEKISIDVKEGDLKKSDITHLLNMSKIDKEEKKLMINGIWIVINFFGI